MEGVAPNKLAPKNADGTVYWQVRGKDGLGRKTRSTVRSFRVVPTGGAD